MNNDTPEFWLAGDTRRLLRNADARAALTKTLDDIVRRLRQFDASMEEHGIEVELLEHRSNVDASLIEYCSHALGLFLISDPDGDGGRYGAQALTQVHGKIRFVSTNQGARFRLHAQPDLAVQPAGTLLFDQRASAETSQAAIWVDQIQQIMEQNPLARAGAEYALAFDLPFKIGLEDRERLIGDALQVLALLTSLLPSTQRQITTIPEFWLNVWADPDDTDLKTRLRIWRLGVMQIAPTTRHA